MVQKREENTSERVLTKEREFEEDCYVHVVLFAAGIAVLMACFKRALMVFLLEEWRAWVFLFLNLVLLAILFTSTLSTPKEIKECAREDSVDVSKSTVERNKKIERQISKLICPEPVVFQTEDSNCHKYFRNLVCDDQVSCREDDQSTAASKLSREELNERAEAFIVMFRRHLVLDARKCGKQ